MELGEDFNHPLEFPSTLRRLSVGRDYMHPLILNEGLVALEIWGSSLYDHPLKIPSTMKILKLDCNGFDRPLDLPHGLHTLHLGNYTRELFFPPTLVVLRMRSAAAPLFLPASVRLLRIGILDCPEMPVVSDGSCMDKFGRWLWSDDEEDGLEDDDFTAWFEGDSIES